MMDEGERLDIIIRGRKKHYNDVYVVCLLVLTKRVTLP